MSRFLLLAPLFALFSVGCHAEDKTLAQSQITANQVCSHVAACAGLPPPDGGWCETDNLHLVTLCKNGCVTTLWAKQDEELAAKGMLTDECRCHDDADCGPEVRRCDVSTGRCLGATD